MSSFLAIFFLLMMANYSASWECSNDIEMPEFKEYDLPKKFSLPKDYDRYELPPQKNGEVLIVEGQLDDVKILDVDEGTMAIAISTILLLSWNDSRITVDPKNFPEGEDFLNIHPRHASNFWMPDVFIDNAICMEDLTYLYDPVSIRLFRNGEFSYSRRLNILVSCPMDFSKFPFDQQKCRFVFKSFARTVDEYQLVWKETKNESSYEKGETMLQFTFADLTFTSNVNSSYLGHSCPGMIATITLSRLISYHWTQNFLPSLQLSFACWFTFFMPARALYSRSQIPVVHLLTFFTMNSASRGNMPMTSYIILADIWLQFCVYMCFFTLYEYAMMYYFISKKKYAIAKKIEVYSRFIYLVILCVFILGFIIAAFAMKTEQNFLEE